MKKVNMKTAIKKYNAIMMRIGYEHNSIGTEFSEGTDNWNLRDMVAEMAYTLSTYYEEGHANHDMQYDGSDWKKMWVSETGKIKRFIKRYEPFIKNMKCAEPHCSNYD